MIYDNQHDDSRYEFELINLSYNNINGFQFRILSLDFWTRFGDFDRTLFGIQFYPKDYFSIDFLFIRFDIK